MIRKRWPIALVLVPLLCLAIFAITLMNNSKNILQIEAEPTPYPETGFGIGYYPGGWVPPSGGSCGNVGASYPDDLFSGWPVDFWPGNWNIVTTWYCDPNYFPGHIHWGIDLARLDWSVGHAIDGAAAWVTADHAIVRQAGYCPPEKPCWNFGMGNFVQVEALKPEEQCIPNPVRGEPDICKTILVPSGWKATYMHLHDITMSKDDMLKRWDVIGHVDNTGNSTGPHLHYQINDPDGKTVDPAPTMDDSYTDGLRAKWKGTR